MNILFKKNVLARAAVFLGFFALAEASALMSLEGNPFKGTSETIYISDVIRENNTGLDTDDEAGVAAFIVEKSRDYGVDPLLVIALIQTESTFNNWARSRKGARGLMQIMPATGRHVARELDLKWEGDKTLFNPYANIRVGIHYLSALSERYEDDAVLTLTAYNYGPARLSSLLRRGAPPPGGYADRVLANYEDLRERAGYY